MMGRYRQGRKILWATLGIFLLLVAVPLSVAGVGWWNEHIAGTEVVAYSFNNETAISGYSTNGVSGAIVADIYTTNGEFTKAQQAFYGVTYENETGWNEVLISTGATGTDNTTQKNSMQFTMNISAQKIINENINKMTLNFAGLNSNSSFYTYIKIAGIKSFWADTSSAYSIKDATTGYSNIGAFTTSENGTFNYTLQLNTAVISAIDANTNSSYVMKIVLISTDPINDVISEGSNIFFKIQLWKPHGRAVLGSYDVIQVLMLGWSIVGIAVLVVSSPFWNPTTRSGLIYHILDMRKRAKRSRSHRSHHGGKKRRR